MSAHPRARRLLTPRMAFTAMAITAVAALGISIATPQGSAYAATPAALSPQSKVAASIAHDTLLLDIQSGAISQADIQAVSKTGLDVQGHHIAAFTAPTAAEIAAARQAPAVYTDAGPGAAASLSASAAGGESTTTAPPLKAGAAGGITESKHWYSPITNAWKWLHTDHWYYINGTWLAWMANVSLGTAAASFCGAIARTLPTAVGCGIVATLLWAVAGVAHDWQCETRGWWVDLPYIGKSHCNRD